uniref:BTB domain-containing protein n=1 Tax=Globodera pallida TaxID=36090 RepID=A0A183BMT5_GLOPA
MDDKSNVRAAEQQPPALYTFVKQYFVENLRKRTLKHFRPTSNEKLLHYALVFFGVELHVRVMFNYSDFTDYYYDKRKECKDDYNFDLDIHKNMYVALKLEIFNEPLANYTSVIQIQQCKEVTQFAFALRKIEYSCTTACKFEWNLKEFWENIPKFGQLFFEALQKYFGEVKYDENGQLMSFTPKLAEHFLERLYTTLTESKSLSLCQIVEELDFVGTMQNVASTEQIKFVKRKKIIPIKAFGTAYNRIELKEVLGSHSFFAFKINILHKMVEIKLPNWKLPDYMQSTQRIATNCS